MTATNAVDLGFQGSFTASAWIKADTFGNTVDGSTDDPIFGTGAATVNQGLHLVVRNRQPYLGFYGNDLASTATLNTNTWYHLTWRYDTAINQQAIFVDGVAAGTRTSSGDFIGTGAVSIGSWTVVNRFFNGQIDNVRVWKRALNDSEVAANMNGNLQPDSTLTADWRMVEGTGTTVHDFGPNGFDGQLVNGTNWNSFSNRPWSVTGATTASGTGNPIAFTPTDNGLATVTVHGETFPILVHNVAPSLAQIPNLNLANAGTGVNEGQTLRMEFARGLDFDGNNDSVDLGTATALGNLQGNFTVSSWIKTDSITGIHRIVGSKVNRTVGRLKRTMAVCV